MRVREEKTRAEVGREVTRACREPIEGLTCSKCGRKTATVYPWPEPTGTCVCPCVTPAWFVDFVRFSSDPARMAESRAREKAERRPRGKRALAISVAAGIRTPRCDEARSAERDSIRFHPPEGPMLPAPFLAFTSPGGRAFEVLPGTHAERWPGDPLWSDSWAIHHEGRPVGKLWRDLNYGRTAAGDPRWSATTRELYLDKIGFRLNEPRGVGYDVAAFDTAEEACAAWSRSADQILDWAAKEAARGGR